ncbi:MAG TPA: tetratricopeptide repeat protein [Tepidisphaeraceae bacterium]|jgi:tetratricopeptide (TPR) repeat protein
MRVSVIAVCLCSTLPIIARGDEFVRQSAPQKWIDPLLPEDLPALDYPSWANDLDKARLEAFHGRYKKSLFTAVKAAATADPVELALVKAKALTETGRPEEALDALSLPIVQNHPRVQVAKADILSQLGRYDQALALIQEHLKQHPESIAGHYQLGQISELTGDLESAKSAYGWFMVEPQNFLEKWQKGREKAFDNAEEVATIGRAIDRWATITGSYQDLPNLHDTLLGIFVRAYDVIDRAYWPAHVASAEYFLSHDNATQALVELKAAVGENPNDSHCHDLLGKIALEQWNFDAADGQVAAIRKVDPNSITADLLETRNFLQQRRPADAEKAVQRVLARQPNHLEALGLLAASFALRLQDDRMNEVLAHVEKIDPDNASAYYEVAEQLGAMRQYPRAIAKYKVAIDRAPWWTAVRNALGLLYTQSGDEDDAKATLDAAHTVDPYNLKTTNYLRLLDDLGKFTRKESAHFIVMYDGQVDPIIPEYFSDYLESIYPDVSRIYAQEPPVKTYIEVFPQHDQFSVRTTGSPWIGTVGASTGRVIALVSPRKGELTMGAFNWTQVLRHEFTHTVTLAATDNRIPHWMTEGLAVYEEHSPIKWDWVPLLYNAVTKKELFTITDLTWGFIRPKKPTDRTLAYAESFWICTYIQQKWGHDAILKMLAEFRGGASEEATFQKVLGKSLSEFETDFFAWANQQVAGWGYDDATNEKYDKLRAQAEQLVKERKYTEAVKAWEEIVKIRPVDALPHQRLAGLYLTKEVNQPAKAIEQLKVLNAVELKDNRYAKRIARLYRDTNDLPNAQSSALQSVYIDPYDKDAHDLLLEIAQKAGDQPTIDRESRVIPVLEAWIEANRPKPLPSE